jgi:hypothetical protein
MSNLDRVKGLIANGEKEDAIALLASILLKNKNELEAWVLLGDMIEDPARKKDCYRQVLRLSPRNFHALTRLQELQETPTTAPGRSTGELRKSESYSPDPNLFRPTRASTNGAEIVGYLLGGIAAFFIIVYVISRPDDDATISDSLYVGLMLLSLIAGIIVLSVSSRNRG